MHESPEAPASSIASALGLNGGAGNTFTANAMENRFVPILPKVSTERRIQATYIPQNPQVADGQH
jgi:hypothetical protein